MAWQIILGLPIDLWLIIIVAATFLTSVFFRLQVKSIPVSVLFVRNNLSALLLPAEEDLQGVFLTIKEKAGRFSKSIDTIKKEGLGLDVLEVNELKNKAYLAKFDPATGKSSIALNVHLGGMKFRRMFLVREGTGETLDITKPQKTAEGETPGQPRAGGAATVLHEMRGAFKALLSDLRDVMKGGIRAQLLMLLMAGGSGGMVTFLILIFTGHLR